MNKIFRTMTMSFLLLAGLFALGAKPAHATLNAYTDLASFQAAAGATSSENFDAETPRNLATPSSPTFNGTFSKFSVSGNAQGDYYSIAPGTARGNINGTNFLYCSETAPGTTNYDGNGFTGPDYQFNFTAQITAIGFNWTDTDPSDNYKVTINGRDFTSPPFVSGGTGSGFFGVVATGGETFTLVSFLQNAAGGRVDPFGIDNVLFTDAAQSGPNFLVNVATDKDDGVCSTGDCSLREAINAANSIAGTDTINFVSGITYISLTQGALPALASNVSIIGNTAGVTVDGEILAFSVLKVNNGATVSLSRLTLTNGSVGVGNSGALTVNNCTFSFNAGSGLYNESTVNATNCTFDSNVGSSGFHTVGGNATAANCTSTGNRIGANAENGGTLDLLNCTISGNNELALYNFDSSITVKNTIAIGGTSGAVNDGGNNIIGGTAAEAGLDPAGLKNNGGPTQTIALTTRGTAVNSGSDAAAAGLTYDQRGTGFPRKIGSSVDIGAYESSFVNQAPTLQCPAAASTQCTTDNVTLSAHVEDADGNPLTVTWVINGNIKQTTLVPTGGPPTSANVSFTHTYAVGTTIVQVNVSDGTAAAVSCTTTVTVKDNTAPVPDVAPLADVTGQCSATIAAAPTATDNCAGQLTGTTTDALTYTTQGTHVVTWTYDDGNGNTFTQTQNVVVKDTTKPDVTKGTIAACYKTAGDAEAAALAATTATDNCSAAANLVKSASTVGDCEATITVTVTDEYGNFDSVNYATRIDNTPPTVTKGTIAACYKSTGDAEAAALAATTATDNCEGALTKTVSTVGDCEAVITVTFTDGCGNAASVAYKTRIDNTPPVITCPKAATVDCSESAYPPHTGTATATDNCGKVEVTFTDVLHINASKPRQGTIDRTWTAKDECGNVSTCLQIITVTDTKAPVIVCPAPTTVDNDPGLCSAKVTIAPLYAADICDVSVEATGKRSDNLALTAPYPVGTTTIRWTATDSSGNAVSCDQTITVKDVEKPKANADTATTNEDTAETIAVLANDTDNCGSVTLTSVGTASHGTVTKNADGTVKYAPAANFNGTDTFTYTITDAHGNTMTGTVTVTVKPVNDQPKLADVKVAPSEIDENNLATVTGTFSDVDLADTTPDTHKIVINWGDGSTNTVINPATSPFTATHLYADDNPTGTASDVNTITVTLTDSSSAANNSDTATTTIKVNNVAPVITSAIAGLPVAPIQDGTAAATVTANATFSDVGTQDTHTATWTWGDGATSAGTVTETNGSGSVSGSHTYTTAGVYTITLTVEDDDTGVSNVVTYQFVVVYAPEDGFVTGGGWINSPAGAYKANPTLTGKANFGFNSKYKSGQSVPTGNTEFQFHAGNMNFKSSVYEWMVISGQKVRYRGTGTINGSGSYGFELTAIDSKVSGAITSDRFRIKIWDKNKGNSVVYDNQVNGDAADGADPTTTLGGGNITIHKS